MIDFSPILVTLFDHYNFTNFGDFFWDYFVESPKFSLKFVNNFVPILVTFFDPKNCTNFGNFFWDHYRESVKISPKLMIFVHL